ncbi:MAG: hypothetical protein PHS41_00835 [Victivallaceae bacterium]|nr:hypothetical protein [Victivallaceae bacterium]
MALFFLPEESVKLAPLHCAVAEVEIAGRPYREHLKDRLKQFSAEKLEVRGNFFPSKALLEAVSSQASCQVVSASGKILLTRNDGAVQIPCDEESLEVIYPWQLLNLMEKIFAGLTILRGEGVIRPGVTIDGEVHVGAGTIILPGVYIEGKVFFGRNCKIGPNCYLRGPVSMGDNCHIGQAVEVKCSLLMTKVAIGHLSYAGDSVIGSRVNFGAGTIISNFRHDGANHRSMSDGVLIDTGRRKFGAILGDDVHTGIHTSIYPGRKIGSGVSTLPGEIVRYDKDC